MNKHVIEFGYDKTQLVSAVSYVNNNNRHFHYASAKGVVNDLLNHLKQTAKEHIEKGFNIGDLNGAYNSSAGCTVTITDAYYNSENSRYILDAEFTVDPSLALGDDRSDFVSELL